MISPETRKVWQWIFDNGGSARVRRVRKSAFLVAHKAEIPYNKQAISELTAAGHVRHFGDRIEVNTWPA